MIIAKRYEMELVNSGKADMVADQNFRASIRQEREEQQYFASEETAKALGRDRSDFLLRRVRASGSTSQHLPVLIT